MPVKVGDTAIGALAVGDTLIGAAYVGDVQVFTSFVPERYVYSVGVDQEVHKISPDGTVEWTYTEHSNTTQGVAVNEDGYVWTGAEDHEVHRITPSGQQEWVFTAGHAVIAVAVDQDDFSYAAGYTVAASRFYRISPTGNEEWEYRDVDGGGFSVAVGPNGDSYFGTDLAEVHRITSTESRLWTYTGLNDTVFGVDVDVNGDLFATAGDPAEVVRVDDQGNEVWKVTPHGSNGARRVAVSPDWVFSCARDNTVRRLSKSDGSEDTGGSWPYAGHSSDVQHVAIDPEGNVYSCASDDEVHKITPTGDQEWVYTGHSGIPIRVAVDPGRYAVSSHLW